MTGFLRIIQATVHSDYRKIFKFPFKNLLQATQANPGEWGETHHALQIYRNVPIMLCVNLAANPLVSADLFSQYVGKRIQEGMSVKRIFKDCLKWIEH